MKKVLSLSILFVLVFFSFSSILTTAQFELPGSFKNGPYVDKVVYKVVEGEDQRILAIQNDEIDMIGEMIDPTHLATLEADEDIEIAPTLRNGYGYISINTAKYPLNITAFRRALAFALDKQAISDDAWDGLSQPLDSCVPVINPFSCEGKLGPSL